MAYGSSKKPLFDGLPAVVLDALAWEESYDEVVVKAVNDALDQITKSLQLAASEEEKWAPYAERLYVNFEGGGLEFMIDGTAEEIKAIEELEYGSFDQAPKPLIRPQMDSLSNIFKDLLEILLAQEAPAAHA